MTASVINISEAKARKRPKIQFDPSRFEPQVMASVRALGHP